MMVVFLYWYLLVLWFLSGTGTSYIARSTCLSSGNEKKDCGNFGWKDCSKALLKLKSSKIVMKLKIVWERQWMDWTKVLLKTKLRNCSHGDIMVRIK